MTTGTAVSVEEYLRTSYEPNCEYVDGVLVPKAMGTKKHGKLQFQIATLIERAFPNYETTPEQTVRITATKYLVPDLAVERRDESQDPYPITPVHLCIEILSPGDRLQEVLEKCDTYHGWGTPYTWVVDPLARRAWQYSKGSAAVEIDPQGELTAGEIHIRLGDVFSVL
jgi:Uma2 family endonuclease